MLKEKQSKFYQVCPRHLDRLPCESCPLAMERVNSIKSSGPSDKKSTELDKIPGCYWYIASSDNYYCFWVYAQTLQGSPASDKEICDLLLVSPSQLAKIQEGAEENLRKSDNRSSLTALADIVNEMNMSHGVDMTVYLPDEFRNAYKAALDPNRQPDDPPPAEVKRKRSTRLPLHRDGKKTDLYGLYSSKSMIKQRDKRIGDAKKADPPKDSKEV